jgi:acyl-CoA reductase-like NAD-dependent aldehyde dehydrogenase
VKYERDALLIGGRWQSASDQWADIVSPSTETPIGRVRRATTDDIDAAVFAARRAFDDGPWRRLSVEERSAVVIAAIDRLRDKVQEIGTLITAEMGNPISDAVSQNVPGTLAMGKALARHALTVNQQSVRKGRLSWALIEREPIGVVGAIVPWNGPFFIGALKTLSPLLAGCAAVVKPAEETPLDLFHLGEALYDAGLPEGVLSIVPGDRAVGEHLVRHPGVDKVAFTGSTAAGRQVGAICGEQLKPVDLELGGKSAAIVLDDADLDLTVAALRTGAFYNSGQVCAALTRILVSRERHDEIVARLGAAARGLEVGDPFDPRTEIGPLASERQRDRVEGYLRVAGQEGARVVAGGGRPSHLERGYYVEPTVVTAVDNSARIAREEIFGPVALVLTYEDLDEAVAIANDSPYGLHGGVFTADGERGVEIARRLVTGTVSVNSFTMNSDAPFGGRKSSGFGREFGPEGIASFLDYKTINVPESVASAHRQA